MSVTALAAPDDGAATLWRGAPFYSGTPECIIYVDRVFPVSSARSTPIVMVHGGCHTGACYLGTPDGREGWAQIFARAGYDVFVVDWPGHGRSPVRNDLATLSTHQMASAILALIRSVGPAVVMAHSASGPMAWWIAEQAPDSVAAIVGIAPGAPANVLRVLPEDPQAIKPLRNDESLGCPVMFPEHEPVVVDEEFMRSYWANAPRFPLEAFDQYRLSIVPESARLFNERFNIGGRGLRISNPGNIARIPKAVLTGGHDPRHPREMDEATARYVGADFVWLPDQGIIGNGHMPMIENNNAEVAEQVIRWLKKHGL